MAIEMLKGPQATSDAGIFNLPPAFDKTKFAAEWVAEDQVPFKQQRQVLAQVGATADGWEIWKENAKDKPTTTVGSGGKKFVLMCRPKKVQEQVNALFGNVSKKLLTREIKGHTVAGEAAQDPGMLTEQRLQREVPGERSEADESIPKLNPEPEVISAATTT